MSSRSVTPHKYPPASFTIPLSRVQPFLHSLNPKSALRIGQAFHLQMDLYKMHQDKAFCDLLWETDGQEARDMISTITDYQN